MVATVVFLVGLIIFLLLPDDAQYMGISKKGIVVIVGVGFLIEIVTYVRFRISAQKWIGSGSPPRQ